MMISWVLTGLRHPDESETLPVVSVYRNAFQYYNRKHLKHLTSSFACA